MYICIYIYCGIPADPQLPQLGTLGNSCVAEWLRRCRRFIQLPTGKWLKLATATCHLPLPLVIRQATAWPGQLAASISECECTRLNSRLGSIDSN